MTRSTPPGYRWPSIIIMLFAVLTLAGCAASGGNPSRIAKPYVVFFSVTRTADHMQLASSAVPVTLGTEARVKIPASRPSENQPVVTQFLVRLNRKPRSDQYELVTRVAVREAIRNKKGKLKISQRFIGALVPSRPGETQIVSAEADSIHVEARLERR